MARKNDRRISVILGRAISLAVMDQQPKSREEALDLAAGLLQELAKTGELQKSYVKLEKALQAAPWIPNPDGEGFVPNIYPGSDSLPSSEPGVPDYFQGGTIGGEVNFLGPGPSPEENRLRQQWAALPQVKTENLRLRVLQSYVNEFRNTTTTADRNRVFGEVVSQGFDGVEFLKMARDTSTDSQFQFLQPTGIQKSETEDDLKQEMLDAMRENRYMEFLAKHADDERIYDVMSSSGLYKNSLRNPVQECPVCHEEMQQAGISFVCKNAHRPDHHGI